MIEAKEELLQELWVVTKVGSTGWCSYFSNRQEAETLIERGLKTQINTSYVLSRAVTTAGIFRQPVQWKKHKK